MGRHSGGNPNVSVFPPDISARHSDSNSIPALNILGNGRLRLLLDDTDCPSSPIMLFDPSVDASSLSLSLSE
jgi:hypothetical protein